MGKGPRSAYLDNAKAILITLVVLAHSMGLFISGDPDLKAVHRLILLFHMPAFIFVSGYLSKPDAFSKKGLRSLATLGWTYLLFNLMNWVWTARFEGRAFDAWSVLTAPNYALWFLLALVWWRLMLPLFAIGDRPWHAAVSIAVAVILAIGTGYVVTNGGYLTVSRAFAFLPFFVAGYRAKQMGWKMPRTWWSRLAAIAAFAGAYAALNWGNAIRDDAMLYLSQSFIQMDNVTPQAGLSRLAVMTASAVIVAAFLQLVPRGKLVISALGATTISVYVWHAFSLRNIRHFELDGLLLGTWYATALAVLAMVIVFGYGPIPRATLWVTGLWRKKGS